MTFYTGASLYMMGIIVVLLLTLPQRYQAGQWRIAWVGFDIALRAGTRHGLLEYLDKLVPPARLATDLLRRPAARPDDH